jgi:hypothetical protein
MSRRVPMPSPRGTNAAGLFLPSAGGYALDAAPAGGRMPKRTFDAMYDYLAMNHGQEVADGLWNAMVGPAYEAEEPAEDEGGEVDGRWRSDISDLEKTNRDELPDYSRKGLPQNAIAGAMDNRPPLDELTKHIKIGPVY